MRLKIHILFEASLFPILLSVLTIFLSLSIVSISSVSAETIETEAEVYAKIESFTWKEYTDGTQLLKESGPIYGIGAAGKIYPWETTNFNLDSRFRGNDDYVYS